MSAIKNYNKSSYPQAADGILSICDSGQGF
jgi:hypothetical protein